MKPRLVLTLPEYQRLFQVLTSVLDGANATTERACVFYAIAGALLIEKVFKREARPVAGAAFYRLDDATGFTLAYGRLEEDRVGCDDAAFHCWIESEGTIIDLMAPVFQRSILSEGRAERIKTQMFQRPRGDMSQSPYDLEREGSFFHVISPVLTNEVIQRFLKRPANGDLVNVCMHWFRRPPAKIATTMQMGSNDGLVVTIRLNQTQLTGVW